MLPCNSCAYRQNIPGNTHDRCTFDWLHADEETRKNVPKARDQQVLKWFLFPYNYDPLWGPDTCPGQSDKKDPAKVAESNAFTDLLSLMS